MSSSVRNAIRGAARRILRPLVRVLLRNGVACAECIDWLKQAYVEVAMQEEFQVPGRKPTVSRAAVITGLTRKDVRRLLEAQAEDVDEGEDRHNRAARVVAGWVRDRDFRDASGEPRMLPFEGEHGFAELVRRYSGDMPPRAVFDELLRVGAVAEAGDDRVGLRVRAYVPAGDDIAKLHILGTDVAALVETIDHNLRHGEDRRYQRKVRYDNIPLTRLGRLRPAIAGRCQILLEELDGLLAEHDRDTNPEVRGEGRGVAGVGIYYFEQPAQECAHEEQQ